MSRIGTQPSSATTTLLSLAAGAVPLVAGLLLTVSLADDSLRKENLRVGAVAVEQVDRLLEMALSTADTLEPLAGHQCEEVLPAMRQNVAANPWLHSAALLHKGEPYCNTISGTIATLPLVAPRDHSTLDNLRLELRGPGTSPHDFGLLIIHKTGANHGVRLILDNRLLVDRMDLVSGTTDVAMRVGEIYLWDDGSMLRGELRQNPRYRATSPSPRFDYDMHSSVSAEDVLNLLTQKLITILGALCMVSILTGGLCHWVLTRHGRQPLP